MTVGRERVVQFVRARLAVRRLRLDGARSLAHSTCVVPRGRSGTQALVGCKRRMPSRVSTRADREGMRRPEKPAQRTVQFRLISWWTRGGPEPPGAQVHTASPTCSRRASVCYLSPRRSPLISAPHRRPRRSISSWRMMRWKRRPGQAAAIRRPSRRCPPARSRARCTNSRWNCSIARCLPLGVRAGLHRTSFRHRPSRRAHVSPRWWGRIRCRPAHTISGALHGVLQLAHVSRPGVALRVACRAALRERVGQGRRHPAQDKSRGGPFERSAQRQGLDVRAAAPSEGAAWMRTTPSPIEEVLAKLPPAPICPVQIAVRGRDQSEVDTARRDTPRGAGPASFL